MNTLQTPRPPAPREQRGPAQPPAPLATPQPSDAHETVMAVLPPIVGAVVGIGILIAVGMSLAGSAGGFAALTSAMFGAHSAWYLSRASAFAAYVLLWWSMVLGLALTNKLARIWPGGPTVNDLHEHAGLLGLVFGLLHAFVLLGDSYIGYTLPQIVIPFASTGYAPLWVGLGQISLYMMALVTVTFYMRRRIGRAWRSIHYLSFGVFVLALLHGLFSGTDSSAAWAFWMYVGTGLSVLALTIYRIVVARRGTAPARPVVSPSA